ncbi:hypothetical protein Leryth_027515 [Lithospermum erythrorhizon]|nr:hypothetical protein Leryth_027515 [Lithospermum erythrorhizon]
MFHSTRVYFLLRLILDPIRFEPISSCLHSIDLKSCIPTRLGGYTDKLGPSRIICPI